MKPRKAFESFRAGIVLLSPRGRHLLHKDRGHYQEFNGDIKVRGFLVLGRHEKVSRACARVRGGGFR